MHNLIWNLKKRVFQLKKKSNLWKPISYEFSESLVFSGVIFSFFLLSGVGITVALYVAHTVALRHVKPGYFLPYAVMKAVRIVTLAIGEFFLIFFISLYLIILSTQKSISVSFAILFSPTLIKTYFYASIYGLFETLAGAIALEVSQKKLKILQIQNLIEHP